jgi:hypothetical protein
MTRDPTQSAAIPAVSRLPANYAEARQVSVKSSVKSVRRIAHPSGKLREWRPAWPGAFATFTNRNLV